MAAGLQTGEACLINWEQVQLLFTFPVIQVRGATRQRAVTIGTAVGYNKTAYLAVELRLGHPHSIFSRAQEVALGAERAVACFKSSRNG
jgi:hypothetical protein